MLAVSRAQSGYEVRGGTVVWSGMDSVARGISRSGLLRRVNLSRGENGTPKERNEGMLGRVQICLLLVYSEYALGLPWQCGTSCHSVNSLGYSLCFVSGLKSWA